VREGHLSRKCWDLFVEGGLVVEKKHAWGGIITSGFSGIFRVKGGKGTPDLVMRKRGMPMGGGRG